MSYSGSQVTRLGHIAIPRSLTGSFAGKTAAAISPTEEKSYTAEIMTEKTYVAPIMTGRSYTAEIETSKTYTSKI